ncbi:hypothetical protein MKZ38_009885 [Zalerion maritima]|uniref:Uncharacterized protein n=1 Tax=Zalerion maritima TaxID=339359 RepID=A0AAD5WUI1_9PEZI|nr:hypothetical protein MKZ38_009885 [Zalerion maritima]
MTPDRRRSLERQLKDLKELARHDAELAQLLEERRNATQSQVPKTPLARHRPRQSVEKEDFVPSDSDIGGLGSSGTWRRNQRLGVKISEITKLSLRSNLRQWGDWKDDLDRLFRSDSDRYATATRRIDKALDFMDSYIRSLWKVEVRRSSDIEFRYDNFTQWARKMINGGTDGNISLYEKYDEAKQLDNQSPFEFDAYLTSLEALMDDIGSRGFAISFFTKLQRSLRNQIKASGDTLPKDRREIVAKAQRAWEATRYSRKRNNSQQRPRSRSPKRARYNYEGSSSYRPRYNDHHHSQSHHTKDKYEHPHKRYEPRGRSRERKNDRKEDPSSSVTRD